MATHPKLERFSKAKHIKWYSEHLEYIEKDLAKLGCSDFMAEIVSFGTPRKSLMARLFTSPDRNTPEEVLEISTVLHGYPVEMTFPMSLQGIPMPYTIRVILPVPMKGRAEYRVGGMLKNYGWYCEPPDKRRVKDLKHSLPSIPMRHVFGHVGYSVQIGSTLQPASKGRTEWLIHAAHEGPPTFRRRVGRFLEVIPTVEGLLRKWNN